MKEPSLKLFVIGESSGNPADWSGWRAVILARDAAEAEQLAEKDDRCPSGPAIEVNRPGVISVDDSATADRLN